MARASNHDAPLAGLDPDNNRPVFIPSKRFLTFHDHLAAARHQGDVEYSYFDSPGL